MSKPTINISNFSIPFPIYHSKIPNNAKFFENGVKTTKNYYRHIPDIKYNVAGAILGEKHNFLFQVEPGVETLNENVLVNKIYKTLESLDEIPEKVVAFISGGIKSFDNSNFANISYDTYNIFASALESLGASVSMLCGKDPNSPPDNMVVLNNGIYIKNDEISSIIEENPGMNDDEIMSVLESKYYDVQFSDKFDINVFDRVV